MIKSNIRPTWCPGCTNFLILESFVETLEEMKREELIDLKKVIMVCGIGCHGKLFDYLNLSGFNALHGRALPLALGIKLANKELKVVCFVGDGDMYCEGLDHLIHLSRYNADIKVFVHNNQNFALTTGQPTSTSQKGFKSKAKPEGENLEPLDPVLLLLSSKASFVARTYCLEIEKTKEIIKDAILHKGFSFVDILQPCITFNDFRKDIENKIFWLDKPFSSREEAISRYLEISKSGRILLGIVLKEEKPTFEEIEEIEKTYAHLKRKVNFETLLKEVEVY